jgi:hypothetical protein
MATFDPNDVYVLVSDPVADGTARVVSLTTGEMFTVTDQQLAAVEEIYLRPVIGTRSPAGG